MKSFVCLLVFWGMLMPVMAHPPHSAGDCIFKNKSISYTENKNQWNKEILFKAELPQGALFVEKNAFTYLLNHPDNEALLPKHGQLAKKAAPEQSLLKYHAYKMYFVGANENPIVTGKNQQDDYKNYCLANDPKSWTFDVKSYQTVLYENLYPSIDLQLYSEENNIKYDLILHAGADPNRILFEYEGLDKLELSKDNLILYTSVGEQMELKPEAYQIINNEKRKVGVKYVLSGNRLSFELDNYDKLYHVVIDPVVYFATYSGSTVDNWGYTATYDNEGNVYMGGIVFGRKQEAYPDTIGAFQVTYGGGGCDIAIMRLNKECSAVKYATYLGGNGTDMPHSMIVNETGELIIYGTTGSSNFPTTDNAYRKTFSGGAPVNYLNNTLAFPNGVDIFIAKFDTGGTRLLASTYIGGSGNDGLNYKASFNYNDINYNGNDSLYASYGDGARGEIITDNQGNIYVGSCTFSNDFPTTKNAFQPKSGGGEDGVVFKLNGDLSKLIWSSYLGGRGDDAVYSVSTDSEYNIIVAGGTNSTNFPTSQNAYQKSYSGGSADAFVTRISSVGNTILNSTYFGTNQYDQAFFIRLDKKNRIYLLGQTKGGGTSLVHRSQYFVENGSQFVSQFSAGLSTLNWSTMFGSGRTGREFSPDLSLSAFGVDNCNRTYISGWGRFFTNNRRPVSDFGTMGLYTTTNAFQDSTDGQDFYILCLNPNASSVSYASFLGELYIPGIASGNDHVDGGTSRFSKFGTLYQSVCASCGNNSNKKSNFPVSPNAVSKTNKSDNCNNAVFSMSVNNDFPVADFIATPVQGCAPLQVKLTNTGRGDRFFWDFGNGNTSTLKNPIATYNKAGIYIISLSTDMNTVSFCGADTLKKLIMVLGNTNYPLSDLRACPNISTQMGIPPIDGLTYKWSPEAYLTDPYIANPFATTSGSTRFRLIVSNGVCKDTIYQWLRIDTLTVDAGNDITTCNTPQNITVVSNDNNAFFHWSSNRNFTDTLNVISTNPTAVLYFDESQYLYVKAANRQGCIAIDSVFINFKPIYSISYDKLIKCYHDCDAEISIQPTTYTTFPLQYFWNNVEIFSPNIDSLCAGVYLLNVRDAAGCSQSKFVEIKSPIDIIIFSSINNTTCKEICDGNITALVTGGTTPYSYLWSTGSTNPTISNLCAGSYTVTVTDANGCIKTNTFQIKNGKAFTLNARGKANTCRPYCTGMVRAEISNKTYPIKTLLWNTGDTTLKITNLCAETYIVTVTDSLGCRATDTITIGNNYTFDSIRIWADTTTILEDEVTQLHATEIENVGYVWQPKTGLSSPLLPNTMAHPPTTTTYQLQARDSSGCSFTDTITINVIFVDCGKTTFFIPNAFTPNGDGKNDMLCIESEWVTSFAFMIYNRWGEKVFETKDPSACWDGRYKGKECESGVYVYALDVQCRANKNYRTKGDITLIR